MTLSEDSFKISGSRRRTQGEQQPSVRVVWVFGGDQVSEGSVQAKGTGRDGVAGSSPQVLPDGSAYGKLRASVLIKRFLASKGDWPLGGRLRGR